MTKTKAVNTKYLPVRFPVGGTILVYLLYKSINPQGSTKGVVLTLFIGWLIITWTVAISQIWAKEFREPLWSDKK